MSKASFTSYIKSFPETNFSSISRIHRGAICRANVP